MSKEQIAELIEIAGYTPAELSTMSESELENAYYYDIEERERYHSL